MRHWGSISGVTQVARDLGVGAEVLRKRFRRAEADAAQRTDLLTTADREEIRLFAQGEQRAPDYADSMCRRAEAHPHARATRNTGATAATSPTRGYLTQLVAAGDRIGSSCQKQLWFT